MSYIKIVLVVLVASMAYLPEAESIAVMSVDIGSEWLKIAIVKPGVPMEIALNKESRRKTPFVVAMKGEERTFSDPALAVAVKHPPSAYVYLSHILGKKYDSAAVQLYKKRFPYYKLAKDEDRGTVLFKAENGVTYSVEELVAMILNSTRHIAQKFANHPMKDVVLTVPVYFNQAERKALLDAANMTSLNVLQLMNDNTAVALNYGIFRAATFNSTMKHILFFDVGASYTTATIVGYSTTKVKDRGYLETVPQLVVKGVGFDTGLGGLEMDMRMRDFLVKSFKAQYKTKGDITESPRAMAKMLKEAKRLRQVLSANTDHKAQIENVFEEKDFSKKVTRAEYEEMCHDLIDNVEKPVKMALSAASMRLDDIESVILMGGGSRIPKVQEILLNIVKKKELGKSINADEAGALGAVYKAADLTAGFKVKRFLVKDLNLYPLDVCFERTSEDDTVRVITRNLYHRLNPLPQKKVMTFNKKPSEFHFNVTYGDLTFMSKDLRKSLDLDTLSHIKLSGVDAAHGKNTKGTPKGVKAYFHLDESGILNIEKVQAHFEKTADVIKEEEQSTFAKLGSKLSSFFGAGKKEEDESVEKTTEEPSTDSPKEDKKEEKTEDKKDKKPVEKNPDDKAENTTKTAKSTNSTANATDNKTGNATEEVKPAKPVIVKEDIQVDFDPLDIPVITKTNFDASVEKLNALEARDQAKHATEMAHNALESYIYELKDKLEQVTVQILSTKDEREKLEENLNEASNWLEDEGYDSDEQTFKKKLKSLKESARELQFRLDEHNERPKAIASILQSLNISNMFFGSLKRMPDSKDIYTEKDLKDLEKIRTETKDWLFTTWKKQNETDAAKKPVLLIKDIISQQGKLDRELMYLINKAKYYVPKPKPKVNTTASNNTAGTKKTNTTNVNNTATDNGKKEKTSEKTEKKTDKKKAKEEDTSEEKPPVLELGNGHSEPDEDKTKTTESKEDRMKTEESTEDKNKTTENKDDKTKGDGHHIPEDEL